MNGGSPKKRFQDVRVVVRVVVVWFVTGVALYLLSLIISGLTISGLPAALAAAAWIGVLNALIWPLLMRFALPVTVLTLGLGGLILNGLLVWLVNKIVRGFDVDGLWWGIVVVIVITLVNIAITGLLAIDDDDFYYRNVIKRAAKRRGAIASDVPALYFLEIDGLAYDVLVRAIRDGNAPTMARWLRDGSHHLIQWECDWSSQTGAAQTGLLLGSNEDVPAFRWWDKTQGRPVSSSALKDVVALEASLSTGKGLLFSDGASRANMYSGDAPHSLLTISTVTKRGRGMIGQDYFAYFANPYSLIRTISLIVGDIVKELREQGEQARRDIWPRVHRGWFPYPLMRAWMVVAQRDLQVSAILGDIYSGRPVLYTTFSGYDEMAHHAGIERHETLKVLRRIDKEFARLERAAADAPRPVRFAVLSDHGQTQGETFLQRYGISLHDLVERLCQPDSMDRASAGDEGSTYLSASLTEASQAPGALGKSLRRATDGKRAGDAVVVGAEREQAAVDEQREAQGELPELSVMASGNLGLVSFPRIPGRATREQIDELYPLLIPALREHPGIGFVFVRSESDGALALGASGVHFLDQGRIEGDDPLAPYGSKAPDHVRRTDGYSNCPDLMVNSTFWDETGEVAAFEELCGSHGGMGGTQMFPFALVPSGLSLPPDRVVGPSNLHRWLRRWLVELGHEEYRDGAADGPA